MIKLKIGIVIHLKSKKTALISISNTYKHSIYNILITRKKNYLVHYDQNELYEGQIILIRQNIRISKKKSWIYHKSVF